MKRVQYGKSYVDYHANPPNQRDTFEIQEVPREFSMTYDIPEDSGDS